VVRRINLIPVGERRRTKTDFGYLGLVVVVLVVVGGMAASYLYFSGRLADQEQQLADLQAQNQQIQTQLAALSQFDALQQQRIATEQIVQKIYAGRTLLSEIMGDLSLVVPENVWFTALSIQAPDIPVEQTDAKAPAATPPAPGKITITARTYGFEDVARFLVRMGQIPGVSDILLSRAGKASGTFAPGKNVKEFSVDATVKNIQPPDTPLPLSLVEVDGR
jgi:Tfp pilus assembly protein PilN